MGIAILSRAHTIGDMQDAVDATTLLNRRQIRRGKAPLWWNAPHIRYRAEARIGAFSNVERFNTAEEIMKMGADDCDGHAPWLAASMQVAGVRARALVIESPGVGYHVVVEMPDGRIIDPSARRGMLEPAIQGESRTMRLRRQAFRLRGRAAALLHVAARANGARSRTAYRLAVFAANKARQLDAAANRPADDYDDDQDDFDDDED
jgi:hypothetical protein